MDANILKYLRSNGEQLDADISKALNVPMARLQPAFAQLAESGELICCKVTRFINGRYKLPFILRSARTRARPQARQYKK